MSSQSPAQSSAQSSNEVLAVDNESESKRKQKLLNVFEVTKEMLTYRGVNIELLNTISNIEIGVMLNSSDIITMDVNMNAKLVFFLTPEAKQLNDIPMNDYINNDINHIMFYFDSRQIAEKKVKEILYQHSMMNLEILDLNDYIFNISKHNIVPHHEIVKDEEEIRDLCSQYNVNDKTLFPLITINDPMAKFVNAKQGDLIRITRKSINVGETIVYRFCI